MSVLSGEDQLERFFELEEQIGILVEYLIVFRYRGESEKQGYYEKQQFIASAIGRFRRYPAVLQALRRLHNDARWYFRQDMKHETKEEFEEARSNLESSYKDFYLHVTQYWIDIEILEENQKSAFGF